MTHNYYVGSAAYGALTAPRISPDLLALASKGRVYDLSFPISARTPSAVTTSPFLLTANHRHSASPEGGVFGEATEILTMSSHTATHLEALCHVSEKVNGRPMVYGDIPAGRIESDAGFTQLGIEHCPPVLCRGLLLDVARLHRVNVLPDSYGITPEDLAQCCASQNVEVQPGDCVLIRTGFTRYREIDSRRFTTVGAGPTPEACRWLGEKTIALTGSDTMSFEQVPSTHDGHLELIRRRGISIIKQVNLEAIAKDRVDTFLLIVLPLRLVGATASPIRPIAIG
jgi:kynurenine formamidase